MLSFIVPAHNEERFLPNTLRSILEAADSIARPFEVIVVDDASEDRTAEVAREGGATVVSVEHRQIAATRNAGARAARGDVLFFVDADTQVSGPLIAAALDALSKGAVGGGARVAFDRAPFWAWIGIATWNLLAWWFQWAAGCFVFATKQAFAEIGGFDETYFVAEEIYLSRALGRVGRFVVVRERVVSSGRKFDQFGVFGVLWTLFSLAWRGPKAWRDRSGLDLWYDASERGGAASGNDIAAEGAADADEGAGNAAGGDDARDGGLAGRG